MGIEYASQPHALRSDYAWIIDEDVLFDSDPVDWMQSEVGVTGPRNAPDEMLDTLNNTKEGHVFRMYDDDGELYYVGRLVTTSNMDEDEDNCYAPLRDFGAPNAGCTEIEWEGHPEWDVS